MYQLPDCKENRQKAGEILKGSQTYVITLIATKTRNYFCYFTILRFDSESEKEGNEGGTQGILWIEQGRYCRQINSNIMFSSTPTITSADLIYSNTMRCLCFNHLLAQCFSDGYNLT